MTCLFSSGLFGNGLFGCQRQPNAIAGPNCDDMRVHAFYWVSTTPSGERMNTGDKQELKVDLKKCDWPRRSRICVVTFQSFVDSTF